MSTEDREFPEGVRGVRLSTRLTRLLGYGVWAFRAGPFLIDCGFRHAERRLIDWPGLDGVRRCLLTHHHEDHAGNVAALAAEGIVTLAPPPVAQAFARPPELRPYQRAMWGTPEPGPIEPLTGPIESEGWRLAPVPTPGHAPDHHVYHEPERGLVFAGDLYLGRRVPAARPEEDVHDLIRSLERVRALEPAVLFCGHRGRIEDPPEALTGKIEWLESLVADARALAWGGRRPPEIARRLLGREGLTYWITGGDLSRRNLVRSAIERG